MSDDFIAYLRALAEKHPWTVRSAARMRQPLDGADAQALEGALCSTERERNEAQAEVERLRAEVERLHQAHQAACEGGGLLREEIEKLTRERDEARAEVERLHKALHKIAGKVPFADDPWTIARKELEAKP